MKDGRLEREEWLSLARRQARENSTAREEQLQPFQWPPQGEQEGRISQRVLGLPLAWGVAAVTLVLLFGVTGTYAYVRHLQHQRPRPAQAPIITPILEKAPVVSEVFAMKRERAILAPRPLPEQTSPVAPPLRKKRITAKVPTADRPGAQDAPPAPSSSKGEVIFTPGEMPGGGELILVNPPPKMGPLWSAEEYRKHGRLGSKP